MPLSHSIVLSALDSVGPRRVHRRRGKPHPQHQGIAGFGRGFPIGSSPSDRFRRPIIVVRTMRN